MTMPYRIEIGKELSRDEKIEVHNLIDAVFFEIDTIYNKWNPDSELTALNNLKAYEKKTISPKLASFLKRCDFFVQLSCGKFDPTVEAIQQLWKRHLEKNTTPSKIDIEKLRSSIGWQNIVIENNIFYKKQDQTAMDLSGCVKGYAVDLFVERLKAKGYENTLVDWGGEMRAHGHHPQGRNWTVYIANLDDLDPEHALAYLPLINQAIATSGDYLQYWTVFNEETNQNKFQKKSVTYFHVFDPVTLRPLAITDESIASASCLASDCLTADALATMLLMCQNMEEAKALAERLQKAVPNTAFWIMSRKDIASRDK